MAVTGKPLAATAGAMIFEHGGNAVDAACAMIAATSTMWDTLSWGGETQALIYNPHTGKVIGINGLGVAPTGATPEYFHKLGMKFPPEYGPLAAVTPGHARRPHDHAGRVRHAESRRRCSRRRSRWPTAIRSRRSSSNTIEHNKDAPASSGRTRRRVLLPHPGSAHEAPEPGEMFRQPDLAATLRKLVEAEKQALAAGKDRKDAIYAAYERFYKGDIAQGVRARRAARSAASSRSRTSRSWKVKIEEPVHTSYKGIEVYKLTTWVQGPVMLQALNILENFDLKSMGYDSARYIHTLYQAMNLAYADRDFYYGDPDFAPALARSRACCRRTTRASARSSCAPITTIRTSGPGDPYPFQGGTNPFARSLEKWHSRMPDADPDGAAPSSTAPSASAPRAWRRPMRKAGRSRSRPSGGWVPAVIAGHTGIGLSPAHAELRARSRRRIPSTCSRPASARAPPSPRRWR